MDFVTAQDLESLARTPACPEVLRRLSAAARAAGDAALAAGAEAWLAGRAVVVVDYSNWPEVIDVDVYLPARFVLRCTCPEECKLAGLRGVAHTLSVRRLRDVQGGVMTANSCPTGGPPGLLRAAAWADYDASLAPPGGGEILPREADEMRMVYWRYHNLSSNAAEMGSRVVKTLRLLGRLLGDVPQAGELGA